jgi:thymidylate synthase
MARIYMDCNEAINEIERDIAEMGIIVHPHSMQNKIVKDDDNFSTLEVQNYSFTILNTNDKDTIVPNLAWCKAEFLERIHDYHGIESQRINPGKAWELRKEIWEEFLVDGKFEYTYNELITEFHQLKLIIDELKENPDTRQAILILHGRDQKYNMRKKRIPCSIFYHFMIREGGLDIIYSMRSCDFDTHFPNDIWQACELRDFIAKEIGIKPRLFHMNISSLHRYKNYTKHVF